MPLRIVQTSDAKINPPKFAVDYKLDADSEHKIPEPYPNRSFFMIITGKAGSGKSSFFINSIRSLKKPYRVYRRIFNHIEIFIPKTSFASVEELFRGHNSEKIHHDLTGESLVDLHHSIQERSEEEESTLLIIDDFSSSLKDRDIEKELFRLASNRRHLRLSIMIIQHNLLAVQPRLRKLATHLTLFKTTNLKEKEAVQEILQLTKDEQKELYDFVFPANEKYNFLFVDLDEGKDGLYKTLDKIEFSD
jgi:Cdc6-like AAA superfamily ATPase